MYSVIITFEVKQMNYYLDLRHIKLCNQHITYSRMGIPAGAGHHVFFKGCLGKEVEKLFYYPGLDYCSGNYGLNTFSCGCGGSADIVHRETHFSFSGCRP